MRKGSSPRVAAATTRAQVQAKDSSELLAEIWLWGAVLAARAVVWGKVRGDEMGCIVHLIDWVGGSAAQGFNVRARATR